MIEAARVLVVSAMLYSVSSFSLAARSCRQTHPKVQRVLFAAASTTSNQTKAGGDAGGDGGDYTNPTVTFETALKTRTLQVQKGEVLRTALLRQGISPHNGKSRLINCRGLGTCGTCAVEIDKEGNGGSVEPKDRTRKEHLRLSFPPHGSPNQSPNLRLACQVQVQEGNITIRKRTGFWGQDSSTTSNLAKEYEAELWLGELEYVMDNKSPPRQN
eukprot:scaffold25127_cov132-Cylindrotheca_fusiformis.AAC.1